MGLAWHLNLSVYEQSISISYSTLFAIINYHIYIYVHISSIICHYLPLSLFAIIHINISSIHHEQIRHSIPFFTKKDLKIQLGFCIISQIASVRSLVTLSAMTVLVAMADIDGRMEVSPTTDS
jgi:hypothetical protein